MYTDKWNLRYLRLAKEISTWSKDPSTQVGSIVIGDHGQVLSQGYNGFPRGFDDSPKRLDVRLVKYTYTIHAEMNCIYNASLSGISLINSAIYVYGLPICSECAKGVIQAGIKHVYCAFSLTIDDKWTKSWDISKSMFSEVGMQFKTFTLQDVQNGVQ